LEIFQGRLNVRGENPGGLGDLPPPNIIDPQNLQTGNSITLKSAAEILSSTESTAGGAGLPAETEAGFDFKNVHMFKLVKKSSEKAEIDIKKAEKFSFGKNDISGEFVAINAEIIKNRVKRLELTSLKDSNKLDIKLKSATAGLLFNKDDKVVITAYANPENSNERLKKIELPKGAKLRLDFGISIMSFAEFIALGNGSYFKELGAGRYRIKNGIFKYNNGITEELANCKTCELKLDYATGIVCLYMQNSSLYNYINKNQNSENFAFYAVQNYTLCIEKTKKIDEQYTGLVSLYSHKYLLAEMFMLIKRFPDTRSRFISSWEKSQKTVASLDNKNSIISYLQIIAEHNKKTAADSGCFRIVEKGNERFAKAKAILNVAGLTFVKSLKYFEAA